ncbi:hypothetical protein QYB59_001511 [Clostridium perfringens]|nr:hypothetical protein [Clostridium perfringens]
MKERLSYIFEFRKKKIFACTLILVCFILSIFNMLYTTSQHTKILNILSILCFLAAFIFSLFNLFKNPTDNKTNNNSKNKVSKKSKF